MFFRARNVAGETWIRKNQWIPFPPEGKEPAIFTAVLTSISPDQGTK